MTLSFRFCHFILKNILVEWRPDEEEIGNNTTAGGTAMTLPSTVCGSQALRLCPSCSLPKTTSLHQASFFLFQDPGQMYSLFSSPDLSALGNFSPSKDFLRCTNCLAPTSALQCRPQLISDREPEIHAYQLKVHSYHKTGAINKINKF